jgi:acetyl-CoA carboxylase biotin carboxyl carrier protein
VKDLSNHAQTLRDLAALLHKHGLTELTYEEGKVRIRIRREPLEHETMVPSLTGLAEPASTEAPPTGEPVESPFMGVFYRSRRPNEPPFVEEGDRIDEGEVLCLLEANKVFSELASPIAGVVSKITRENGALVQPGEVLFYIEPSSAVV